MLNILQILTTLLVAIAMALSLAHALELPGKMRLDRDAYLAVQPIYYPGFTLGGLVGDSGGTLLTLILLLATPRGTPAFWLTAIAAVGMAGMHLIYWVVTHPVNKVWLRQQKLGGAAAGFFGAGKKDAGHSGADWTTLRNRWEYSHVARAALAFTSLAALVIALSRD